MHAGGEYFSKGKSMLKKGLTLVMLVCALFSGQLMAGHKGHEYLWVKMSNINFVMRQTVMNYAVQQRNQRKVCANTTCGRNRANRIHTFVN